MFVHTATGVMPGVLLHDGSMMPIEDSIGVHLAQSLASGLTWVSAAEPDPLSGQGDSMPSAVGLSSDGTQLAQKVFLSGHRAYGAGDIKRIGDGEAPVGMAATQQAAAVGPAPRDDFQAVYSRSTGRLFLVGGQDPTTHELLHDIWWTGVDGSAWQQVPLSAWKPERVLAATWSPVDRRLWVIEDTGTGSHRRERIVRVRPGTGEADVFGTWPRGGLFDQHWLVVDRDGSMLVVASSQQPNKHVVARIAIGDRDDLDVEGVWVAKGTLATAPSVDPDGYSFPISTGPTTLPRVVRLSTLERKHGPWSDVGQCF